MKKDILLSVSPYVQKYYFNEAYENLPEGIKDELRAKLAVIAESTNCIMSLGFDEDGEIYIEERSEDPMFYDDIGAGLEIKAFQSDESELLKSLKLWYMIYCTQNGKIVRDVVVLQSQKKTYEQVLVHIEEKYGLEGKKFAEGLLQE